MLNFPFGPEAQSSSALDRKVFEFAGGEIIFNLPNGLQAYYLVNAKGARLDEAPITIVADRLRPERPVVINGISCISCHQGGIFHKKDQVRPFIEKNATFAAVEKEKIIDLHPLESEFKRVVDEDAERFRRALQAIQVSVAGQEPVYVSERSFSASLDLSRVLAELGLSVGALQDPELKRRVQTSQTMTDLLQRLGEPESSVLRQEFEGLALEVAQALWTALPAVPTPPAAPTPLPSPPSSAGESGLTDFARDANGQVRRMTQPVRVATVRNWACDCLALALSLTLPKRGAPGPWAQKAT